MLYNLLTGRPPFQAATVVDTLMQVVDQNPVPLRQLAANIHPDLETICLKSLEKSPRQRYASADEFSKELSRWLHNEPIQARPADFVTRWAKWLVRHRLLAILVVIAALSMLLYSQTVIRDPQVWRVVAPDVAAIVIISCFAAAVTRVGQRIAQIHRIDEIAAEIVLCSLFLIIGIGMFGLAISLLQLVLH